MKEYTVNTAIFGVRFAVTDMLLYRWKTAPLAVGAGCTETASKSSPDPFHGFVLSGWTYLADLKEQA